MNKYLIFFSKLIIYLFIFSIFGWVVKHVYKEDKDFAFFGDAVKFLADFPDQFTVAVEEVKKLPDTFLKTPKDFSSINLLKEDIFLLSSYTSELKKRKVDLFNLRTNEVSFSWDIDNPFQEYDRVMDPILMDDNSICYSFNGASGVFKIDKNGNKLWAQNDIIHHHSMNKDSIGNIWVCSYLTDSSTKISDRDQFKGEYQLGEKTIFFLDNAIVKLDNQTGNVLFKKSIAEIIKENNLTYLLLKSANVDDPIHINDIQPAMYTSNYFIEGDVFISSRNLSCIFHYRPSNNKVIKVIEGGFACQHDVDIINDSTLLFFNNNTLINEAINLWDKKVSNSTIKLGNFQSNIVEYHMENDSLKVLDNKIFIENNIFTNTEGMVEQINDSTYFIEEQNSGVLWVTQNDRVLYKNVLSSQHQGYHHLPNWIRIIE